MSETTSINNDNFVNKNIAFHSIKPTLLTVIFIIFLLLSLIANLFLYYAIKVKSKEILTIQDNFSSLQTELYKTNTELTELKTSDNKDTKNSLLLRCGDIPYDLPVEKNSHFTMVSGPEWSPDCRHIAWGKWESGTSWLGEFSEEELRQIENASIRPKEHEGIYLYTDSTKKIIKIYTPKAPLDNNFSPETPEFIEWGDSKTIIFKVDGQLSKSIDIETKEVNDLLGD